MNVCDCIEKKRDGAVLSREEIGFLVEGFVDGRIPDCQMAAFLMSVYFRGMTVRECTDLTLAMAASGDRIDLSAVRGLKVDKHSTGGVGDKTTLVVAPLVASCGGIVAKMTGRELAHTGGTVDKLESIPGLKVELSTGRFVDIVEDIHVALSAQTGSLAPADGKIYALRNLTATVDSIPLIASSVMSKKLAAGADAVVLDVKTGRGAFTRSRDEALHLAKIMVDIGSAAGLRMSAWITGMDQPLGRAVGNAIEVKEAIETLQGDGPRDLVELVGELGADMLLAAGAVQSRTEAESRIADNLANRKGAERLADLIAAQGGNPEVVRRPELLFRPRATLEIKSQTSAYVSAVDALQVGLASKILGAGRRPGEGAVDHSAGIYLQKKIGDYVEAGEPLAELHWDGDTEKRDRAADKLLAAYSFSARKTDPASLIHARVSREGIERR